MPIGAIIGGLGSAFGAINSAGAAKDAAAQQAKASQAATQAQLQEFGTINQQLQPFLQGGTTSLGELLWQVGLGGGNFNQNAPLVQNPAAYAGIGNAPQYQPLTVQSFQASPGFKAQFGEGEQAIQNSAAAKTGALSGNMLKALQSYGMDLANEDWYKANAQNLSNYNALNNQYWNQYGAAANQQGNIFSRLSGLAGSGQNAAAQLGGFGTNAYGQIGQNIIGAGNAQAAGTVGAANALTGGVNSLANNLLAPYGANGQSTLQYLLGSTSAGPFGGTTTELPFGQGGSYTSY